MGNVSIVVLLVSNDDFARRRNNVGASNDSHRLENGDLALTVGGLDDLGELAAESSVVIEVVVPASAGVNWPRWSLLERGGLVLNGNGEPLRVRGGADERDVLGINS